VVTAVISMARSLNLRVVAEGVETQEELAFLEHHECDEAQGYYFSRPVPVLEFAKLLANGLETKFRPVSKSLDPRRTTQGSRDEGWTNTIRPVHLFEEI